MPVTVTKDLMAASTTPLVLTILAQGDAYGYALIKQIRALSDERLAWSEGMLYPVLRRLETQGMIASYWRASSQGRRRRYYRIEQPGRRELTRLRDQWRLVGSLLGRLWKEDPLCST